MYNQEVCALKEVICSILLHLLQTNFVYKLADDVLRNLIRKALRGHKIKDKVVKVLDGEPFWFSETYVTLIFQIEYGTEY